MRTCSQAALWFALFCLVAAPLAPAQQPQQRARESYTTSRQVATLPEPRPLTLEEGLAVISAALDVRHQAKFRTDCSHFVHGLYERAGFPYTYAPSSALYAGIEAFERVTNPQPGDLAVWRGHAGIVVNPAQHSFFSLMSSGVGIASYDSAYWKKKGRPRFFRYVRALPYDDFSTPNWTASR